MAGFLMNLATQAAAQSIPLALLSPGIAIPDSYLANGANYLKRDGSVAMTGNFSMNSNKITGLAAGSAATDAINLSQLQAYAGNSMQLHFARVVAASNVASLGGLPSIDGVTLSSGDVAFLIAQTTQSQNGPWIVQSGSWIRPSDWAAGAVKNEGHYWIIEPDGTNYKNTKWFLANTASLTVDSSAVTFQQDLNGTSYVNGSGLSLSGATFSVKNGNGIGFDGNSATTVVSDPNRMLQSIAAGVGIKDGTAAQLLMANSTGNASYQTMSGDATISSSGVLTINHTAGTGFLKYTDFVGYEVPGGTVNGTNTNFTLASTPQNNSLQLYKNGQLLKPGSGNDYTISGAAITMLTAPATIDQLSASYFK